MSARSCFPMKRLSNFKSIVKTFNYSLSMSPVHMSSGCIIAAKNPLKKKNQVEKKEEEGIKGFVNRRPNFKYSSWDQILSKTKYDDDLPTKEQQMSPLLSPDFLPKDSSNIAAGPHTPVLNSCLRGKPLNLSDAKRDSLKTLKMLQGDDSAMNSSALPKVCLTNKPLISSSSRRHEDSGRDFIEKKKAILTCKRSRNEEEDDADLNSHLSKKPKSSLMMPAESRCNSRLSKEHKLLVHSKSNTASKEKASSKPLDTSSVVDSYEQKHIETIAISDSGVSETGMIIPSLDCNISTIVDEDSYNRAERTVNLLRRFKDAILSRVTDPTQKEQERDRLRSKIQGIEAMMISFKKGNHKKRIAARIALEKVVKTIEFNDNNIDCMEELHRLYNTRLFDLNNAPSNFPKPLEWLGLSLKVD